RAASGHATAAPPSVMNLRRLVCRERSIVRASAFAVLRLITSSYFVGACTGRSAGFSPRPLQSSFRLAMAARLCVHALADREAFAAQDLAALLITLDLMRHSGARLLFSSGG